MTSPATYRCTACGRTFSGDAPFIRFGRHRAHPFRPALCTGAVVLDMIRDDRAGVTLPTAVEPVGGDQLEPGRVAVALGAAGADVVEQERSRP